MLIDEELLSEVLSALDETTLRTVHGLFRSQSSVLATTATDLALPVADRAEAAHALKGFALQFGLTRLGETLGALECACLDNDAASIQRHSDRVDAVLCQSRQALDHFLLARGIES